MLRDLDLIRLMLLASEQSEGAIGCPAPSECCGDIGRLAFHDELMKSKGQVVACIMRDAFRRITSRDGTAPKSRAARPPGVSLPLRRSPDGNVSGVSRTRNRRVRAGNGISRAGTGNVKAPRV